MSVVLDTRTINKEGTYPVKIKVYYQANQSIIQSVSAWLQKEELEEALEGKSKECRDIQEEIGKELSRILKNVEYLAERGTFSFDRLNTRLGKNIGGTIKWNAWSQDKRTGWKQQVWFQDFFIKVRYHWLSGIKGIMYQSGYYSWVAAWFWEILPENSKSDNFGYQHEKYSCYHEYCQICRSD